MIRSPGIWQDVYKRQAIDRAKELLTNARPGAQTYVIFLTDGDPTYRNLVNDGGNVGGIGHEDCRSDRHKTVCGYGDDTAYYSQNGKYRDYAERNINAAATSIRGLSCTSFYAIGFGNSSNFDAYLGLLCDEAGKDPDASVENAQKFTTTSDLLSIFQSITADITSVLCDHVTVTDVLSDNVTPVVSSDGVPENLTIKVDVYKRQGMNTPPMRSRSRR